MRFVGRMIRKTSRILGSRAGHALGVMLPLTGGVAMVLWAGASPQPAPSHMAFDPFSASDVEEVVASYCVACHNAGLMSGGLALDAVDFKNPGAYAEPLEKMIKKLRGGYDAPRGGTAPGTRRL